MSTTESHAKNRGSKMSNEDRKAAQMVANRKAQLQWWILSGALAAVVIGAIVIISLTTEGELPVYGGHGG